VVLQLETCQAERHPDILTRPVGQEILCFQEINKDFCLVFYKQACDSINRDQLIEIIIEFGIPSKLVSLVKMTLEKTNNKVEIPGKKSPSFETEIGLRQGDALSTLLFDLCTEKVIRNVKTNPEEQYLIE
jgi:hypothetical protein